MFNLDNLPLLCMMISPLKYTGVSKCEGFAFICFPFKEMLCFCFIDEQKGGSGLSFATCTSHRLLIKCHGVSWDRVDFLPSRCCVLDLV